MARRTVRKRRELGHHPDHPWHAKCCGCTWEALAPSQLVAFGYAVRHSCPGFGRA